MMWYDGGWGWGAWLGMTLGMLAFWALVIWAILALVRSSASGPPLEATPEQILAARFARGELDQDEYRQHLDALRSSGATPVGRS